METHLATRFELVSSLIESYKSFENGDKLLNVAADSERFLTKAAPLPTSTGKIVSFQSCLQWSDTAIIIKDAPARIYLQNVAFKLEKALANFEKDIITRTNAIEGLKPLFLAYTQDPNKGDPETVRESFQQSLRDLTYINVSKSKLAGQLNLVIVELGEFDVGSLPHDLRPKSFALPSTCDCCRGNLWELGKNGLQCADCNYKAHNRCELKCPLNCVSHIRKSKKLDEFRQFVVHPHPVQYLTPELQERALQNIQRLQSNAVTVSVVEAYPSPVSLTASPAQTTKLPLSPSSMDMNTPVSTTSSALKHTPNEPIATIIPSDVSSAPPAPPAEGSQRSSTHSRRQSLSIASHQNPDDKMGVAAFDYHAAAGDELSLTEGDVVKILSDNGDGWAMVRLVEGSNVGQEGLVPIAYIETEEVIGELPSASSTELGTKSKPIKSSAPGSDTRYSTIRSVLNKDPSWVDDSGNEINKEATVLFDYDKTADDDFSLKTGETIFVKSNEVDGWIYATNGKEEGYIPISYIQISQ